MAFLGGGIIGFERASRRQSAGLRTHIIIAIGSALLMLLSVWVTQSYTDAKNGDPGRIAAQVVSGIGFLGAGAILRLGNNIRGLTTAASIWLAAALGLGFGAGLYIPCAIAVALSLIALIGLEPIERKLFPAERFKHLIVNYAGGSDFPGKIRKILETSGIRVHSEDVEKNVRKGASQVRFLVRIPVEADTGDLYKLIKAVGDVEKVELSEKF